MHLVRIHKLVSEFKPAAVIVDPISNFVSNGTELETQSMLLRLVDFLKAQQVTALFINLTSGGAAWEKTDVGISSLIDTWLLVRDIEVAGERNRGLYVLKSRGMKHSNQIREFIITPKASARGRVHRPRGRAHRLDARCAGGARGCGGARAPRRDHAQAAGARAKRATLEAQIAALRAEFAAIEEETKVVAEQAKQREAAIEAHRAAAAKRRGADKEKELAANDNRSRRRQRQVEPAFVYRGAEPEIARGTG